MHSGNKQQVRPCALSTGRGLHKRLTVRSAGSAGPPAPPRQGVFVGAGTHVVGHQVVAVGLDVEWGVVVAVCMVEEELISIAVVRTSDGIH